jgi:hypothetical protein
MNPYSCSLVRTAAATGALAIGAGVAARDGLALAPVTLGFGVTTSPEDAAGAPASVRTAVAVLAPDLAERDGRWPFLAFTGRCFAGMLGYLPIREWS